MLHSHNAIAGDLHASVQLARLSIRAGGLLSIHPLPLSRILQLEKQSWSRKYNSHTRGYINTYRLPNSPLGGLNTKSPNYTFRGHGRTEDGNTRSQYTAYGHRTRQHLRFFSHNTCGHRAPLPRRSPVRDSGQPTRMDSPAFTPQKPRKGPGRASILRGRTPSDTVLRGIQSPDAERERQEKESKEEEIKRKAKEAREERERQQRLDRQEKEYHAKVTQPIKTWRDRLSKLSHKLPTSLTEHIHDTRVHARREWQQQYVEQCERPIASFVRQLGRIEALLENFLADAAATLAKTMSNARTEWPLHRIQLLENEIDSVFKDLGELERDLEVHEDNIRALQKAIRTLMPQIMDEQKKLKETGLHKRSRDLGNRYMFGMANVLRCLNDASLINVRQELIERQKWTVVDGGLSMPRSVWVESRMMTLTRRNDTSREPAFHSGIDSNLVRGAHDPKKLEAFLGLFVSRGSLEHNAGATSRLLHIWRQHDTDLRRLQALPYLFSHYSAYSGFNHLRNSYFEDHLGASVEHRVLGALLFLRDGKPNKRWKRMLDTFTRMFDSRNNIEALFYETFCSGMSDLLLTPTSVLERSLIAMYRPFYTSWSNFVHLRRLVGMCYEGPRKLRCSPRQLKIFERLADSLEEDTIGMASTLRDAVPWSGASSLVFGKFYSPHPKSHSAMMAASKSNMSAPKPPAYLAPIMAFDSLLTSSFYTQRKVVSVSYISDSEDAPSTFQGLASYNTLALGAIVMRYTNKYNIRSSRIEFVLLASAENVVIWHSALQDNLGTDLPNLGAILENPQITKVGVNMDFLRRQFSQEYNWEIQGCVNLAGNADPILTLDSPSDPAQVLLAHLARQRLGMEVPATIDAMALLAGGLQDPLGYFRHLASHAYLPLLLCGATQDGQEGNSVDPAILSGFDVPPSKQRPAIPPPPTETVEFGSIFIGPKTRVRSFISPMSRVSTMDTSRADYLGKLTKQLARALLQNAGVMSIDADRRHLQYLQAYHLLATFGQSLKFVKLLLRPNSIDDLYHGVLSVSTKFNLPLYDGHRNRLEAEAVSLGARRTAATRKARGMVHRSLSSDRPVTLSSTSPGRSDSIVVEAAPNEDPRITKAISSSMSKDEPKFLAGEKGRTKNARRMVRRREKRRELRRTDPSFRAAENVRRAERRQRQGARRNGAPCVTGADAGSPAFVVSSSPDDGSTGGPEDAVIQWASFGMRDAKQVSDATPASVTPSRPRRVNVIRAGVYEDARKGRSQPLKQPGERKTRLRDSGGPKVVKVPSLPRKGRR